VSWVSRVGHDPFGSRVVKTIRGEGVDVSRVEMSDSAPTGVMFKEPGPGNTTRVFYYRRQSAAAPLSARSASLHSVITTVCPTGLGLKRSWKEV
jgi:2-dehydro-3-deoxygluconokinase